MNSEGYGTRHKIGPWLRFQCWLVGVDSDLLAQCPRRDLDAVRTLAGIMMGVWVFQSALFTLAAGIALAHHDEFRPELMTAGVLLATLILLIDSFVIMRSSWSLHGVQLLQRGGFPDFETKSARVKRTLFVVVRVALSLVIAALMSIFASIVVYQEDIASTIDRQYQQQNARLFGPAASRIDGDLRENAAERMEVSNLIARAEEEERTLGRAVVDPGVEDPELKLALARVSHAEQVKNNADRELARAEEFASNELAGIRGAPGNSGRSGEGPVRRAAEERLAAARRQADSAAQTVASAQARLHELEDAMTATAHQRREAAETRLAEVVSGKQTQQARKRTLEDEYRRLAANRGQIIQKSVENDPTYVKRDDGFIARLKALIELSADPGIKVTIALVDLTFFLIELAAVLSKLTANVPSTYALELAASEHRDAVNAAFDLMNAINGAQVALLVAKQAVPDTPPRGPGPAGAMAVPPRKRADEDKEEPSDPIGKAEIAVDERPAEPVVRRAARSKAVASGRTATPVAADRSASGTTPARRKRGRPPGSKPWRPEIIPPQGGPIETAATETVRPEARGEDGTRESQDETGPQSPIGPVREPDEADRQG